MARLPKGFAVVLAAGLALFLVGCSKPGESGGEAAKAAKDARITIGFIVKQPEEPWFQLEWKFADRAAEANGFTLMKVGAPDGEKVLSAIDNLAAKGAKGFVICTPDVKLGPAIVAKARANQLKFVAVDDRFVGPDGKFMTDVHYLGISAGKIGESVGRYLYEEMQKRGWKPDDTAVCAVAYDQLDTTRERTDGATSALVAAGFPAEKIHKAQQKALDVPSALDATNILLTQQPNVKHWLVCGVNDSAVLGAVRAMEGRQLGPDSVVAIGINGTDCIAEFRKPKPTAFYGSILLAPKRHGYDTAEMVYKWVKDGVEPPKDTRTMGVLITRDNYTQVLKEQGLPEK